MSSEEFPETPPPPPSAAEVPLPPVPSPLAVRLAESGELPPDPAPVLSDEAVAQAKEQAAALLEANLLRELDEATQEVYLHYADKLAELGELQATSWPGLNETHKAAWRAAVKFIRDSEARHASS